MSHPAVEQFGTGERHDISLAGNSKPTHVWLEQPFKRTTLQPVGRNMTRQYEIGILVLDIALADRSDELQLISNCDLIADWIVLKLRENPPTVLQIAGNWDIVTITEYGGDKWCGVHLNFTLETPMPMGACDVRFYNP